jgi:hypothetical protein
LFFFSLGCTVTAFTTSHPSSEVKAELEESRKTQQQVKTELEDSRRARRESEALRQQDILDRAMFGWFVGHILSELGIPLGPMLLGTLVEQVGHSPRSDAQPERRQVFAAPRYSGKFEK